MNNKILIKSDLRKIMSKQQYSNVFGTPTIEYHFENIDAWIEKAGSKIPHDKNKPYNVRYKRLHKNFKTLNECLDYILCNSYIYDNNILEDSLKNHYSFDVNN